MISVPIASELPVAEVSYRTSCVLSGQPPSLTTLEFTTGGNDLGAPPVGNLVVVAGVEFAPILIAGTLDLTPVPEVAFVRGDCNSNGDLSITDVVTTLNFIFGNGGIANCLDACDANDSGSLNLADPIHCLTFMFAAGPEPSGPYPLCGLDPTPDSLGCAAFTACPSCQN